jgi:hypothetical protein
MHPIFRLAARVVSRLAPLNCREALLGDLTEEYALRAKTGSPSAACWWCVRQLGASTRSLLWFSLTETAWLSTFGVALLAFLAAGETQFLIRQRLSNSFPGTHTGLGVLLFIPAVALIGYFAEGLRRRSAVVLGLMMLASIIPMTFGSGASSPLWVQIAWLLIGPAAALPGLLPSLRRAST